MREKIRQGDAEVRYFFGHRIEVAAIYGPRPTPRQLKFRPSCVTFSFRLDNTAQRAPEPPMARFPDLRPAAQRQPVSRGTLVHRCVPRAAKMAYPRLRQEPRAGKMTKTLRWLLTLVGLLLFALGLVVGQQIQRSKYDKYLRPANVVPMDISLLRAIST